MAVDLSKGFRVGFGGVAGVRCATESSGSDLSPAAVLGFDDSGRGVVARGSGCSYGDAAQRGGGTVLKLRSTARIAHPDPVSNTFEVSAGETIGSVCRGLFARGGWFLPVVPGTAMATIGGAIAADVHGKNHIRAGSFGEHVVSIELIDGAGIRRTLSRSDDPDGFWATIGGMGLTGVIVSATLRAIRIGSTRLSETTSLTSSIDDTIEQLRSLTACHDHVAAWIDLRSREFGAGVVTASDHLIEAEHANSAKWGQPSWLACPRLGFSMLSPRRIALANVAKRTASRWHIRRSSEHVVSVESGLWPLDALREWQRLYGPAGFVQYQVAVPDGEEASLVQIAHDLGRLPVYLATLKRFGGSSPAPLSFPIKGWTLALDIPATAPGLWAALDVADEAIAAVGGRVYLAKDVRLKARHVSTMYPRLDEWRETRDRLDPKGRMRSDLGCRLGLVDSAP